MSKKLFLAAASLLLLVPALVMAGPAPGSPAPDFTLPDTAGINHTLSSYRGHVVQLFFWQST